MRRRLKGFQLVELVPLTPLSIYLQFPDFTSWSVLDTPMERLDILCSEQPFTVCTPLTPSQLLGRMVFSGL